MKVPSAMPKPSWSSTVQGQDGVRQTVVRIGWVFYIGGCFFGFFLTPAFGGVVTLILLFLTSIVMLIAALAIARAGTGPQRVAGIVALLLSAAMTTLAGVSIVQEITINRTIQARTTAVNLSSAIKQYVAEYGLYPRGSQIEITRALIGNNGRKIVFFEPGPKEMDATGEILDPWGAPYRIDLSDPTNPKVYSFGKDKRDDGGADGSDDIRSWK